ncbi:hypothetical protein ABEF95_008406 [Exophiala dermatitidis]
MLFTSSSRLVLASFALTWAVSTAEPIGRREESCKDVHIFLAKGNNEPYPGRQGKLAGAICYGLDSCDYEDIQYYNPVEADYCASVTEGAQNGLSQVTAYAARCPDAKLVLSGYSQGAQIVGDVLGGGGGVFFNNCTQPVNAALDPTTSPGNKIVAALVFGDTRHVAGQPYNVESGAGATGLFPRSAEQLTTLNRFSSVLRSYCVATDPICAASYGSEDATTHLTYFDVYTDAAAGWVKEMVNEAQEQSSTTTTSTTSSATTQSTTQSITTTINTSSSNTTSSSAVPTSYSSAPFGNSTTNSTSSGVSSSTKATTASLSTSAVASSTASTTSAGAGSTTSSSQIAPATIAPVNGATRAQGYTGVILSVMGFLAFAL